MKTAREILEEHCDRCRRMYLDIEHNTIDGDVNPVLEAMEEYADQFKTPVNACSELGKDYTIEIEGQSVTYKPTENSAMNTKWERTFPIVVEVAEDVNLPTPGLNHSSFWVAFNNAALKVGDCLSRGEFQIIILSYPIPRYPKKEWGYEVVSSNPLRGFYISPQDLVKGCSWTLEKSLYSERANNMNVAKAFFDSYGEVEPPKHED